ncbi:tetratricopeptide repeat-containing sulfotransferase family protein [Methylocystis heyeri]|uniref:Tetratricopeptide repeat protein n=1 Tax=Methylocystis heyeri TaxID=391905 RepID=A0A6B8KC54_9HYPH|nr:tetratricopeptide repeat-containing sulfotransferase family protein [Methylocystis heyeri]QGM45152.1 tetratricopeptide repeat protein [Methylocystis heyeri]
MNKLSSAAANCERLFQQAAQLFRQGKAAEAEALCRRIAAARSDYFPAFHLLGAICLQQGRPAEALGSLSHALDSRPPNPARILADLGLAQAALGQFENALASYDQSLALAPDQPDVHHRRGAALAALRRTGEAIASFDQALRLRPGFVDALNNRGVALSALGRAAEALASYDQALALKPDFAAAHYNRGGALMALNRPDEAVASYDHALALRPDNAAALLNRGNVLFSLGRQQEALASFDSALASKPGLAEALYGRANALERLGWTEQALASFAAAAEAKPDYADAFYNRANLLQKLGRLDEAVAIFGKAVEANPAYVEAWNNRGNALMDLGRPAEALASYEKALAIKGDYAEALVNRANALLALTRLEEAFASAREALAARADYPEALNSLGNALGALHRHAEALACFDRALVVRPAYAEALNNRGNALLNLRRPLEALASFDSALALRPGCPETLNNRGNALRNLRRFEEALESFERALAVRPNYAQALNNRGNALGDLDRAAEALENYDAALRVRPDFAEVHDNKGGILLQLGRAQEAVASIRQATKLAPQRAFFHYKLASARRWKAGDPEISEMEALARRKSELAREERIYLQFALAKVYEDIDDRERCFSALLEGNALKRERLGYDEAAMLEMFERTAEVFSEDMLRKRAGDGDPSPAPVFILGMPRSGTTLVEQILSSHPAVFGAGELDDLSESIAVCCEEPGENYPDAFFGVEGAKLRELGARYVAGIGRNAPPGVLRITDKTPDNFRFIGLIRLALPNARIIHVRRDPLDTCFSCFSRLFAGDLGYIYDLGELGRYYRAYEKLMAHWRAALPKGAMLEVQYEEAVADLESFARGIVDFCNLDWDPRCLDFHRQERLVRTSSLMQVRQPIYNSSIGRWRAYEAFLGPLIQALER